MTNLFKTAWADFKSLHGRNKAFRSVTQHFFVPENTQNKDACHKNLTACLNFNYSPI